MAEPIEHVDDTMKRAAEAIRALRRIPKGETAIQARARACAAIAAQRELAEAAHRTMTDAIASKRISNGNGTQPAKGLSGFTENQVKSMIRTMAIVLRPHFDAYDKRLAALEARPVLEDAGVWDEQTTYPPGRVVTCDGSAWVSRQLNSHAKPGSSGVWRLLVSRGRNGRDAKGSR